MAYNADGVRDRLLAAAGSSIRFTRRTRPGGAASYGVRSAALGTPEHLYPLGPARDAVSVAWAVLDLLEDIAEASAGRRAPHPGAIAR